MEITTQELINLLNQVEKPTFVYIVMETKVGMNKTGNPYFDQVTKVTKGNFFIGGEYQKRVNKEREKEGLPTDFVPEPPKGKRHISKCVLTDTKTEEKHYLMMEYFEETPPHSVEYFFEGETIEKQLFEDYMKKSYTSKSQGTERNVNVRTPLLTNIKVLHIDGMKYEHVPEPVQVEV